MCPGKFDPLFVPSAELVASLRSFFGLGAAFPWHRLAARSPQARSLVLLGEQPLCLLRRDAAAGRLRVVSSGVRLFDAEVIKGVRCAYRLCHEGLQYILPHLSRQRAPCATASLLRLMERGLLTAEEVRHDTALASALDRCAAGSLVLECCAAAAARSPQACRELAPPDCISICCQLAPSGTLRPMVSKAAGQRQAVLRVLQRLTGP